MPRQARAEATRRRILDSAVDLFTELGYGETGLADVLQRAGVSKGAFYYHFDSKEAVATAIIEEFDRKVTASSVGMFDPAAPDLEGIIRASFESAAIIRNDRTAKVGHELLQGLSQISPTASRIYQRWTNDYVGVLTKAIGTWKLRHGVSPRDIAEGIWAGILGTHLLSAAMDEEPFTRLSHAWRALLSVLAPEEALGDLTAALESVAAGHLAAV